MLYLNILLQSCTFFFNVSNSGDCVDNFISLYNLFLNLIDFNIPCVIQLHFLCLYLFNFTVLTGKFCNLAFSIMPSNAS